MHRGALRALEFEKIVAAAASYALTPTGAARLQSTAPETDPALIERAQDHTAEAVRYLTKQPVFPLRAPEDLEEILTLLGVEGRALDALHLLALGSFLESVEYAASAIRQAGNAFPRLATIVGRATTFDSELRDLRRQIDATGEVVDDATPALRNIRDRLRRHRGRLRESLDSLVRGRETSKYLQEQVVTERNGRFVVLVKAEHKSALAGIVHGSSASGATLFVEPLATVDINNDIVALEQQEREEVQRILLALTDRFRGRLDEVATTTEVATELDVLQARAQLAAVMDAVRPVISQQAGLRLHAARHPLLMKAVVRRFSADIDALPDSPAPVDIVLEPPDTALLITGPNTGGKTVALKTAGLVALMAQSGFHIPAEVGSSVPAFQSVFADIGDEQSISASLSTFSWHIQNIAAMDRELRAPALVLLDEIGAGTDPVEGGALGIGIVEHFRSRGALVVGTTHYDALKSYASTTPGVVCAAFGFEPDGFRPTYRLSYGSPGRSLALEIAARLGLADAILAEARCRVGHREAQLQDHLARMDKDLRALEEERDRIARERQALSEQQAAFTERDTALREREAQFRRRATERIDERVREARREIDALVEDLKKRTSVLTQRVTRDPSAPRLNTGQTGAARAQAQAAIAEVAERLSRTFDTPLDDQPLPGATDPQVGDRVAVSSFGVEGTVNAIHTDGHVDVDVRGKRMRARLSDIRVVARPGREAGTAPSVRVNVHVQPREGLLTEINVIGCTVDEALTRTDRFLDETLITEQRSVRVVHGHGKGQLRRAIADLLKDHPLVASFHAAPPEQGGGGVTVVELKD
jgi:DNA mismatch repair protein MutS2